MRKAKSSSPRIDGRKRNNGQRRGLKNVYFRVASIRSGQSVFLDIGEKRGFARRFRSFLRRKIGIIYDSGSHRGYRFGRDGQDIRLSVRGRNAGGQPCSGALRRKGRPRFRHTLEGDFRLPDGKAQTRLSLSRRTPRPQRGMSGFGWQVGGAVPRAHGALFKAVSALGNALGEGEGAQKELRLSPRPALGNETFEDGEKPARCGGKERKDGMRIFERPVPGRRVGARKERLRIRRQGADSPRPV